MKQKVYYESDRMRASARKSLQATAPAYGFRRFSLSAGGRMDFFDSRDHAVQVSGFGLDPR